MKAMWTMLQQYGEPMDFVIATGESHTVREMCQVAFDHVGLDPEKHIKISKSLYRPCEVPDLRGNPARDRGLLGWRPEKKFKQLITEMVDEELRLLNTEEVRDATAYG